VISGFPFAFLLLLSYVTGIDPCSRAPPHAGRRALVQFPAHLPAAAATRPRYVLARVRAGLLGVSIRGARGLTSRTDAGDLDRGLRSGFELYDYSLAPRWP